ncbi:MAG: hypothetical protein KC423_22085, partial [Anaerolineales bacterium]|nr:hypothetical protein [Anaerolineales bacterium]
VACLVDDFLLLLVVDADGFGSVLTRHKPFGELNGGLFFVEDVGRLVVAFGWVLGLNKETGDGGVGHGV